MENDTPVYGMEAGDREMAAGSRWPWIRPKDGDRLRFHFLTTGSDPWLVASKFHLVGSGMQARNLVCVSALTRGEEQCQLCDMEGGQSRRNMFGMWLLVDYILHPHDNPDEEGESWEQKQLKVKQTDGTEKQRAVFLEKLETEDVGPGQVKFLHLPAGRNRVWWNQFNAAWMTSQDLRKHFYELHRVGSGRDDTNYTLTVVGAKENPLDEALLEREDIVNLPDIAEVFRSQLGNVPTGDGALGSDSLDQAKETPDELPSAEETATPASNADDLI